MSSEDTMKTKRKSDSGDDAPRKNARLSMASGPPIDSELIRILVGPDEQPFGAHQGVLETDSSFFKAAFSHDWKEKNEKLVKLPEQDPESFQIYTKWLYTQKLFINKEDDVRIEKDEKTGSEQHKNSFYTRWGRCYALADFLGAADFKDALIDSMIDTMTHTEHYPTMFPRSVYPYSTVRSPHRKLVVDIFHNCTRIAGFDETTLRSPETPPDFLVDMTLALVHDRGKGWSIRSLTKWFEAQKDLCKYHEHTDNNTPCYKTKRGY